MDLRGQDETPSGSVAPDGKVSAVTRGLHNIAYGQRRAILICQYGWYRRSFEPNAPVPAKKLGQERFSFVSRLFFLKRGGKGCISTAAIHEGMDLGRIRWDIPSPSRTAQKQKIFLNDLTTERNVPLREKTLTIKERWKYRMRLSPTAGRSMALQSWALICPRRWRW